MLLTEEQATEKRCCGPDGCGFVRVSTGLPTIVRYCIASQCMAWRQAVPLQGVTAMEVAAERKGYCGLAGMPTP